MNLDQFVAKLKKKVEIAVGFPADKQIIYPPDDRKGHYNKGGQTVAQVATWNEKGTKKIPSRPFLSEAFKKNRDEISNMIKWAVQPKNLLDPSRFDKIGIKLVSMVRDSITNGNWIPNAPYTKYMKSTWGAKVALSKGKPQKLLEEASKIKPLIDRGIMRKSVTYEVREL